MQKLAVLLATRNWSERLPGKGFADICGKPVLDHIIDRYRACDRVTYVIVCTSLRKEDDSIAHLAELRGVALHRSNASEHNDVVQLLNEGLQRHAPDASFVHRGMCDCPLFEPYLLDWYCDILNDYHADVVWVGLRDDPWPIYGAREAPWSRHAWDECVKFSTDDELIHPGLWIYRNLRRFRVKHITTSLRAEYYRPYRLELDTPEDMQVIRAIFDALYEKPGQPTMLEAIQWLDNHPDVAVINERVELVSLTVPDFRRRGVAWTCEGCGATPMEATVIKRGGLETQCPRCGEKRRFVEVPAFVAAMKQRRG